ncbi:hypothetical protein [Streptomyces sp. NBC_00859]|uniref:hypothetical protein n=1 Tax=Streptomyces sp. NBC_00859 TaxID=2903682 RepID=UPI003869FCE2|nr:hypothetical protein OG584_31515 [Streptomyces sp. NBC_00859]
MTVDTGGDRQRGTAHGAPAEPEPIDWQAERHWNDRPWVQVALALVIAGGVAVVLNVLLRDAWGRSSGGTGGFGGFCAAFAGLWSARRVRRQVAEESGLSPWQVPIVGRWLRKGRVPADPKARRAMAALARQQRRASQRSRWSLPVLMTLFAVGGVALLATGYYAFGALLLAGDLLLVPALVSQRRTIERLPRIEEQLAAPQEATPPPPPAAGV